MTREECITDDIRVCAQPDFRQLFRNFTPEIRIGGDDPRNSRPYFVKFCRIWEMSPKLFLRKNHGFDGQ